MGLGSAVVIYLAAVPKGDNPLGLDPEDSKRYLREMEVFGGKVNLIASQLTQAWKALWQGRNLAFTVAGLTLLVAFGFWFIATRRARDLATFDEGVTPGRDGFQ